MSSLKIEAARRQLGTALYLYLQELDPVAVHCLAAGGCELIEFYVSKVGAQPLSHHMLQTFPDLEIGGLRKLQREYWNAFKHATHMRSDQERPDDDLLAQFTDVQNDHALFIGWYDYALATNRLPIEAQAHQVWYLALYPEKLSPQHSNKPYEEIFPKLRSKSRLEQKQALNSLIKGARSDLKMMTDPQTDERPLVLGWP